MASGNRFSLGFDDVGEVGSFKTDRGTYLVRVNETLGPGAIIFSCILNEDVDGAPNCYARFPNIKGGLDDLNNAKSDESAPFNPLPTLAHHHLWQWVGVANMTHGDADAAGLLTRLDERTELAGRNGPVLPNPNPARPPKFPVLRADNPGFYVATTALPRNLNVPETDPNHWWDASAVSYGAVTPPLKRLGVELGDFGLAIRRDNGLSEPFFYADAGHQEKVGEMSRHVFTQLSLGSAQEGHPIAFIVFPGSRRDPIESNVQVTIRRRLFGLSTYDNVSTLIGLLASGFPVGRIRELHYQQNAAGRMVRRADLDPAGYGPAEATSPQFQTIARALQTWGYNPALAHPPADHLSIPPLPDELRNLKIPKP